LVAIGKGNVPDIYKMKTILEKKKDSGLGERKNRKLRGHKKGVET